MREALFRTENLKYADVIVYPNITIWRNLVTFITGESGSGKSTLFKLFNAAIESANGCVCYCGQPVSEIDTILLRRAVSLVSQEVFLFSGDIRNNFAEFYKYRNLTVPNDETIKHFLQICCLLLPLEKDVETMSGGEKQRLYIAIFLSLMPKVLLLDEPTSALDEQNSLQMLQNIIDFTKKHGLDLVIICHDPHLTELLAEDVIVLEGAVS